jgi:hypothetical protein
MALGAGNCGMKRRQTYIQEFSLQVSAAVLLPAAAFFFVFLEGRGPDDGSIPAPNSQRLTRFHAPERGAQAVAVLQEQDETLSSFGQTHLKKSAGCVERNESWKTTTRGPCPGPRVEGRTTLSAPNHSMVLRL